MPPVLGELGFGCANLDTADGARAAERLLETAIECGIKHFDVARSYGDGRAESILGRVARRHNGRIKIVTKAGIDPPNGLERLARKMGSSFGARLKLARRRHGRFRPAEITGSVHKSLRKLGMSTVDVVLLHDCRLHDLTDEVLYVLQAMVQNGDIGAFGIAASVADAKEIICERPAFGSVVQTPDDGASPLPAARGTLITHSISSYHDVERYDLKLKRALERNATGIVLFSSCRIEHIRHNVQVANELAAELADAKGRLDLSALSENAGAPRFDLDHSPG